MKIPSFDFFRPKNIEKQDKTTKASEPKKRLQIDRFQCCLVVAKKGPKMTENRKYEKTFFWKFLRNAFQFFSGRK